MKKPHVLTYFLLLPLVLGLTLQEDDLVFDDVGEEAIDTIIAQSDAVANRRVEDRKTDYYEQRSSRDGKRHQVERLWGVQDVVVPVGHVFKLRITRQAFGGSVDHYEVREANGHSLSRWMFWDDAASTLMGVPSKKDVGSHHLTVKAIGRHGDSAKDAFIVQVIPEKREELKHKDGKTHCDEGEDQTLLTILLDAKFENLTPSERVNAIENLAGFLGLHTSAFSMHSINTKENFAADSSILFTGPGNVKHRTEKHLTSIQWQVGCDGHLWKHQTSLVKQLRDQAKDGTLAEVLELPVLLWRVRTDSSSLLRSRREVGSGDFGNPDDYEGYDEDYDDDFGDDNEEDEDDNESITESPLQPSFIPKTNVALEHPHRHHHGEETIDWNTEEVNERNSVRLTDQTAVESGSNVTSTVAPVTTTTQLTTPPSATTSTTMPTSATSTTQAAPAPISTTTSTTMASTTTDATTAIISTIVASSTESPKSDVTDEITDNTKNMEVESFTLLPTIPPEFTIIPPSVTIPQSSTAGTSTTLPGRTEAEATTVIVNITMEEPTDATTVPPTRSPTTIPPTSMTTISAISTVTTPFLVSNATTTVTPQMTPQIQITQNATSTYIPNTTITISPSPTTSSSTTTTSTTTTITTTTTTSTTPSTTETPMTTTPQPPRFITESIEYETHNFSPKKDRRLKKIPVTAGKPLSYVIPADTFSDLEDGDTRNLKLSLYLQGVPLKSTHWLQFNPHTQEVYGLPLENDISTWDYELVATDVEGLNVSDRLDVHVQQHKLSRTVNHEFSIYLRIDKRNEFATDVDWELKVIRSLAELYGDSDPHHITVRSVDIGNDQAIFTWTNDSLPRSSECPKEHINALLRVLLDKDGDPSPLLKKVLAPEIRVKRVVYRGLGQCEDMNRPEIPKVPTQEPKVNIPPIPRNQVDHINATVGQLLVFKVPEDTFFDAEDGSSRNMKISLLTIDRTPIPPHEWLQFDSKNQEFYGVPLQNDAGRKEYQLVVTDKEGASATDGLVVVVHPALPMKHTVEFSMTLDIPYESFAYSALQKRNFIETLRDLYRDKDTSAISLHSISNGSTVITWHNRTLPTTYCAHKEVSRLRSVLVKSDNNRRSVADKVLEVMGVKFPVKQITVIPMGICLGELTGVHSPDSYIPPVDDSTSVGAFHDDYLITFVLPAIIIAVMLILAGIIACVLYKRRRSGKMSVSEQDDERQSFRSKGIPVIFQDELDEKPDPGNKSPVILKEEKPPLPPPEYQKTEDGADVPMLPKENSEEPYQPPPPFATNRETNRQNRPKPTPTYRKPPPYVPP